MPLANTKPPVQVASAAAVDVSTAIVFAPKVDKNPFLSMDDYRRMEDDRRRLRDLENQKLEDERRRREGNRPGAQIFVQGIIGRQAIVNNRTVSVGETVMGAKVIRIDMDENYVTFEQDGHRFTKQLQ